MMLAITIPDSGTRNAILRDPADHSHVVLDNFRVYPIDGSSLNVRRQVQLKIGGKNHVFLGNYARTTVGAIVATAAYMDVAFTRTSDGAASWLNNMISDPSAASAWVDTVLANKFPPLIRRVS